MPDTIDSIAERILANTLGKQEAIRIFENLSEAHQKQLVAKLRQQAPHDGAVPGASPQSKPGLLRTVDQRELTGRHREFIGKLVEDYGNFVPKSKAAILAAQKYFVDQRRPFHLIKDLKNLHFQITYRNADGAYVFDIDGNKYVDISGDMGVNLFGHKPEPIMAAAKEALDRGVPLAGYSETIHKAAKLFCELTGHERMLYTQSGTEAVMFAVRIARAATRRKKIVIFEGSFHGLSDAVVAMRDNEGRSLSIGPGLLQEYAEQLIVLDYGKMEDLDRIEQEAGDIAGVLVEPVQSRHPYIKPMDFLRELRKLTLEKDIPLIFDEMITGFRICPRGAQGHFGIKADIATYGKIPGGGLPTGIVAGLAKYMDIVDGGTWNFGDDSMPKSTRTGMGGTHTQNPIKVATSLAALTEIRNRCPVDQTCAECHCFQKDLNRKTASLAEELNRFFAGKNVPVTIDTFGSLFRFRFVDSYWGVTESLFFTILRMNGIETNIQGNCFLTTAHSDEDIGAVVSGVKAALHTLLEHGFFCEPAPAEKGIPGPAPKKPAPAAPEGLKPPVRKTANPRLAEIRKLLRADLIDFQAKGE